MTIPKRIKRLQFIMAAVLLATTLKTEVLARQIKQYDEKELQKYITTATLSLEKIMKEDWEGMQNELREDIKKKGYDYSLTFNELMEEGNPFKDYDFVKTLAAYTAAKKYLEEHGSITKSVLDLHFLSYEITDAFIDEAEYIKIDDYEDQGDGTFVKTGFHYSAKEQEVGIYEPLPGSYYYVKTGTRLLKPELKKTIYGKISYTIAKAEDIINQLGIPFEDISKDYQTALSVINQATDNRRLRQNTFISLPKPASAAATYTMPEEIDGNRKSVLSFANSLQGQIPYQWGGKAKYPGYDPTWWTFDEKSGLQRGLDCSGFVQWAYMSAGADLDTVRQMQSTNAIMASDFKEISSAELKPGDIGVKKGAEVNHTGIYAGNGLWFHCSSEKNTVVLSRYGFTFFYDPFGKSTQPTQEVLDTELDTEMPPDEKEAETDGALAQENKEIPDTAIENAAAEERDIYLLAQLISHEAETEGFNGWVGVAEVVVNRLNSDQFPDSLHEVIYQDDPVQFSKTDEISGITPREEIIQVARQVLEGRLKIFGDPDVLFFRNPKITSGIDPSERSDWGNYSYYDQIGKHAFYKRKK